MTFQHRKAALVAVLAVPVLVFAGIGAAGAQQSGQYGSIARIAAAQDLEEQQQRAEEIERALAMAQEMRVRPAIRLGNYFDYRSSGIAGRVLANSEELELTDPQQETIRDVQRSHRRDEIRRDADIEIAELELEEMMEVEILDLNAIESHMRQVANLQVDERMANLRLDGAVRDLLTPEQIDKLGEMSPERVIFETFQRQRDR